MTSFRTIFATLSLVAIGAAGTAAQTNAPQSADPAVIVTSGEAEVKRAADRAWVVINAESRSKDPKEAQRLNTEAMTAVQAKLKGLALGEDAVRTTSFELHPEFDYNNGRQTLRGYVARNTIEVRVDEVTRVGEVLTVAVGSGATSVGGLRFDLKDRDSAEREALGRAVANARARAEAAASAGGLKVDRILRIDDNRAVIPEPRPMMAVRQTMDAMSAQADVPVTAGNITVRATVSLTVAVR